MPAPHAIRQASVDYAYYHRYGITAQFGDVFERVRLKTIVQVLSCLPAVRSGGLLLDVGAGEGRYLPVMRRHYPDVRLMALEYSPLASSRSASRYPFAKHIVASAEDMPLEPNSVDALIAIEVLEHVRDVRAMLTECARVLRPGAWALISTPCGNTGSLEWIINFLSRQIVPGEGGGILFGKTDDPTHLRRYRSAELRQRCAAVGLVPTATLYNGHAMLTLASRLELFTNRHVNLRRRSVRAEDIFARAVDAIGMLDWRLARRLPAGSTMVVVLEKAG